MRPKENKLSATYDPEPYSVVSKRGDLMVIERGETLLKTNVGHVKRFIQPAPRESQQQREPTQQLKQRPPMEPVILTDPESSVIPAECPVTEPSAEPSLPQPSAKMPEQADELRRSTRVRAEPSWLMKTVLLKRLVDFEIRTLLSCLTKGHFVERNHSLDSSNIAFMNTPYRIVAVLV